MWQDLQPPRRLHTKVVSTLATNAAASSAAAGRHHCLDTVECKDGAVLRELEAQLLLIHANFRLSVDPFLIPNSFRRLSQVLTRRIVEFVEAVKHVRVFRLVCEWLRAPDVMGGHACIPLYSLP